MEVVRVADLQHGQRIPRAELAKRHAHVSEIDLVRDVLYLLQGISGAYVCLRTEWQLPHDGDSQEQHAPHHILRLEFDERDGIISAPTKDVIHRLAELGQLYVRVSQFVEAHTNAAGTERTTQSLCHFIASELDAYYAMVSDIETDWNQLAEAAEGGAPLPTPRLTLLRLMQQTREPLLRMRLMSAMVERCKDARGGALVSAMHTYTLTGDPFIRRFTMRLLDHVSRPFFHTLSRWIYDGELEDPFHEFFVALQKPDAARRLRRAPPDADLMVLDEPGTDAADVWHSKFCVRLALLPAFLSEQFARKIFSTGRSLNFIRCSCGEQDWAAVHTSLQGKEVLRYSDMAALEHTIDTVYTTASTRLVHLFLTRFRLHEHLRALKSYLMLTMGDFADALMQALAPSLSRPAHTLYQHNLSAALETAIRSSNAQYDDQDILRRLDARSLEFAPGDLGWDTFTLEYRVESPVSAVLDASAMAGYQILFNYLWKIKRVETVMNASWVELVAMMNAFLRSRQRHDVPPALLKHTRTVLGHLEEMAHFVRQLQGFCQLEAIAYSWQSLEHAFADHFDGDLDQLIEQHRTYLHTLINKALLRGGRKGQADHLAGEVRAQLDTVLAYCAAVDELARYMTAELARIASGMDAMPATERAYAHTSTRLSTIHAHFRTRIQAMIGVLERHPNLSVRDLARRWNFNLFYRRPHGDETTRS
ncbi:Spc98p [Malassezia vespertilionis]|uniref:Spc98p n=1 Tax=Malassezia vespertilionis TaxID=2020962 RepID=A0A2N1JAK0_9BASI|nr:Spc98p [Malassezia vespertilionis]